jgi:hypothetical protein
MEAGRMPYTWPKDTDFASWELDVLDRDCPACGRMMHICDHRYHRFHTLEGPVELVCKLNHCPDSTCPGHFKTKSPELEITIAPRKMAIGWDVLCWIGHRRCSRHWSVPQIQCELQDQHSIKLSADSLERYIRYYQVMLAARQQDPENLRRQYESVDEIILTIDGLQPEKGHETLYVVRELTQKRVWFAEPLISATADEVQRLIAKAKEWAESLDKPVALWLSDKQDAFVKGIAAEFPDTPHRYCDNHFVRDLASRYWRPTVTPRFKCAAKSVAYGKSNKPCSSGRKPRQWKTSVQTILEQPSRQSRSRRTCLPQPSVPGAP